MSATDGTRIVIVGAGAIGGWVAAKLALAGEQVMALSSKGPLDCIELAEAGDTVRRPISPGSMGPPTCLVIAVKAPALAAAAEAARPLVGPETLIVPMLNGVPWWFVEGEPLRSVDPDGSIAAALPARPGRRLRRPRVVQPLRARSHRRETCRQADHRRAGRRNERARCAPVRVVRKRAGFGPT